jgi:hypothetical protein
MADGAAEDAGRLILICGTTSLQSGGWTAWPNQLDEFIGLRTWGPSSQRNAIMERHKWSQRS